MPRKKNSILTFILSALQSRYPLKSRAMFGGYGLYYKNVIMGIVIEDTLYLKAHDTTAEFFMEHGATPFSYERNGKTVTMCYWKVPEDILEDQGQLENWAYRSISAL